MTWELRKIGSSGRLCLLLVLAVLCNGVLFALHAAGDADGYTVSALRRAMAQKDLPGYEERLWQELEQAAYTGTRSEYDALRRELSAADAALARVRQAEEYPSFRAGLAAESRLKLRMGLFEGFAARSLERGAAVYESLADGQALCREAVYLNLLGSPQDRVLCGAIFLLVLALAAGIVGAALYAQTPGGSGKRVAFTRSLPRPRHTCLAGHELYKALISRCGLWILLAFFAVIALLYGRFTPERSEFEVYYRNYSEFLSGAPSQEKDAYLASEQARFDELNEQLLELGRRYPDSVTFDREAEPIRNQLHAEDAFHMAQNQYRALRPGQVYLYQTGYQRLLGADALRQDVLELGGAFLAVALLLCGSFAGERESGVDALLTASPRRRIVVRWKCAIAGGYVLLLTLSLWLPSLLTVQGAYGQLNMAAQANSVQCLSILSDGWTVGGVVLALLAIRLLLLAASAAAVMLLSRRCAMVPALLLSLLLLLLPVGAAYAWM